MHHTNPARPRLLRDRSGSITVLSSMAMVTLLCFVGLAVDVGDVYDAHRRLQGTTDIAAIAGASNLNTAAVAANSAAANNGYQTSAVSSVVTGIYTNDPLLPMNQRFVPSAAVTANAAQVTMSNPQSLFFSNVFNIGTGGQITQNPRIPNVAQVGAGSIAVNTVAASFTVGSQLATLNGGLINAILGGLLGANLSLSVMDYNALLSTQIDLFQFSQSLATQLNLTGVTYKQVFSASITLGNFITALQAAGVNGAASSALNQIAAAASGNTQVLNLSQLANFGPFQNYQVGSPEIMPVNLSMYQVLSFAAQLAGGGHQIALQVGATVPGLTNVYGTLTVGEPPVGSSMIAMGNTGTSVHTAQTRLLLNAGIGVLPPLLAVNVPIYLEVASATATLSSLSCNVLDATNSGVTLAVSPAVASAWVGTVSPGAMVNFTTEPTVSPATLVTLANLIVVNGAANASVSNINPTNVNFSYSDIQNNTMKATDTTDYLASLVSSLLTKTTLSASLLGLPIAVPQATLTALNGMLTAALSPVDQLTSGVLQTLGVSLGVADSWVNGIHCAPAMVAQ